MFKWILSYVRKSVVILAIIGFVTAAEGCRLFNEGNFPDIDGWWEITFYIQSSSCPTAVTGFSAPAQINVKAEFSYDRVQAILSGSIYENNSFVADAKGHLDENGNFDIQATISRGDDDLKISLSGTFTESSVTGRMSQTWTVNSQNITCEVVGSLIGQKL